MARVKNVPTELPSTAAVALVIIPPAPLHPTPAEGNLFECGKKQPMKPSMNPEFTY